MQVLESGEDYLERILVLRDRLPIVRSIDIVNDMGYSKPSISIAMKKLKENGYINVLDNGALVLTNKGEEIAKKMLERETMIKNWLISIGIDEEIAAKDACKIEHDLSDETFEKLKEVFLK